MRTIYIMIDIDLKMVLFDKTVSRNEKIQTNNMKYFSSLVYIV